jgi:hypothetical protein
MKKDTHKNKSVTKPSATEPINQQLVLQLYEKGLLSDETVLEKLGFNPSQETDRKKNNSSKGLRGVGPWSDNDPEWQKLQKKNMELSNRELEARAKSKEHEVTALRIEHARRNVEGIGKIVGALNLGSSDEWSDIKEPIKEVLTINLGVLKEIKKIK